MVNNYIATLETDFKEHANEKIAFEQKAYLRNQFQFHGIKTPERRKIQQPFLTKKHLPPKEKLDVIVKELWHKPQREYQYFSQELAFKFVHKLEGKDIELFEFMVLNKSWWDTVDFISSKLMGTYFKKYPNQRKTYVNKWLLSNNIWLQRTALLFQLKYKDQLDTELLQSTICALKNSNEFFINKAIGWILREYSRTNPNWVLEFVAHNEINTLSKKEALRLMKKEPSK